MGSSQAGVGNGPRISDGDADPDCRRFDDLFNQSATKMFVKDIDTMQVWFCVDLSLFMNEDVLSKHKLQQASGMHSEYSFHSLSLSSISHTNTGISCCCM